MSLWKTFFPSPAPKPDVEERLEALERGLRKVRADVEDGQGELQKRFGRVWAALKALRNDDRDPETHRDTPDSSVPHSPNVMPVEHGALLREARARRQR